MKLDKQHGLVLCLLVVTLFLSLFISIHSDVWQPSSSLLPGIVDNFQGGITGAAIVEERPTVAVSACSEISSDSTLTANITADGTCFNISADNVVLDGAGYILTGSGEGYGINVTHTNVTIKNFGGINNFDRGIDISVAPENMENHTIFNNNITGPESLTGHYGIFAQNSGGLNITNNFVNTTTGTSDAIYVESAQNSTVFNNLVYTTGSASEGIYMSSALGSNVTDNSITTTDSGDGIQAFGSNQMWIVNNIVNTSGDTAYGLYTDSDYLEMKHNIIYTTGANSDAFYITGTDFSTLENNTFNVSGNDAHGIYFGTGRNNTLLNNNITSELGAEINTSIGYYTKYNSLVYNNTFGEIIWFNDSLDFLGNLTIRGAIGLGVNLFIDNNTIALNTASFSESHINSTANITLYDLPFGTVNQIFVVHNYTTNATAILESGTDCFGTSCVVMKYDSVSGLLQFNSSSFSSYAANGTDPVACAQTLTTNTSLHRDVNASGTCFTIGASNIVVDCNGFMVNYSSDGGSDNYGINNTNYENVTIQNCNIVEGSSTGSDNYAIYLENASRNVLLENNVTTRGAGSHGLVMRFANNSLVDSNRFNTSGQNGMGALLNSTLNASLNSNNLTSTGADSSWALHITGTSSNNTLVNNTLYSPTAEIQDFSGDNYVNYFIYNNSFGAIRWFDNGTGGFLRNLSFNVTNDLGLAPGKNVFVSENTIALNTSAFNPLLINSTANVTLYDVKFNPLVGIDVLGNYSTSNVTINTGGSNCNGTSCLIQNYTLATGYLVFNTSYMASFAANGTRLDINNPTITANFNITDNLIYFNQTTRLNVTVNDDVAVDEVRFFIEPFGNVTAANTGNEYYVICNATNTCNTINESRYNWTHIWVNDTSNNVSTASPATSFNVSAVECGNLTRDAPLNQNVQSNGTCFTIGAANIHIDCNRFTINYSVFGGTAKYAVENTGFSNVTVRNCNILTQDKNSSTDGIYWAGDLGLIESNTIVTNRSDGRAIFLTAANNNTIRNNTLFGNQQGVYLTGSSYNNITGNEIYNNSVAGIYLYAASGETTNSNNITSNTVYNNTKGIELAKDGGNTGPPLGGTRILGNMVRNNTNEGLYLVSSQNMTVDSNTIEHNSEGIHLYYDTHSFINITVSNNTIRHNRNYGIYSATGENKTFINNILHNNTISFLAASNDRIDNNTISGNTFGIELTLTSNATFSENDISNNSVGLHFSSASTNTFTSNLIHNNTRAVQTNDSSNNNSFTNANIQNNSLWQFDLAKGSAVFNVSSSNYNFSLINMTYNLSKITVGSNAHLYIKRYVDVDVTNATNQTVANATVTGYDVLNRIDDSVKTDSAGQARLILSDSYITGNIRFIITNNHTLQATKDGYMVNASVINLLLTNSTSRNFTIQEISCGTTLLVDGFLGSNLTGNNCLIVSGENVTIEGRGYTLTGTGTGVGINLSSLRKFSVRNVTIINFTKGVDLNNVNNSNFSKVTLRNNTYGIIFNESNNNFVFDSIIANNTAADVYANNSGHTINYLINTSVNTSNISVEGTARVRIGWYVDVNVTLGNTSNPVAQANASGYFNSTGILDQSKLTGSDGFAKLTLSEIEVNSSGLFYLTPHNITASYASAIGNATNFTQINLSVVNNTQVDLSLDLNCTAPAVGMTITENITLCPGTFDFSDTIGGWPGSFNIDADGVIVTCVDTTIIGPNWGGASQGEGFYASERNNISIRGCNVTGYEYSLYFTEVSNSSINDSFMEEIYISGSDNLKFNNLSTFTTYFSSSDNIEITHSTFQTGSNDISKTPGDGLYFDNSNHLLVLNTTFDNMVRAVYPYYANNITLLNNTFTDINNYYIYASNSYNFTLNVSNGTAHGNGYDETCDMSMTDSDSDGFYDTGTGYPFAFNSSAKLYNLTSDALIDYGPRVVGCGVSTVQVGSSSSSSTAAATSGSSAPSAASEGQAAAASVSATSTDSSSIYTPEDTKKFLKAGQEAAASRIGEGIIGVTVTLENTGDRPMSLFPQILSESDDPFFIVTRKTLGGEGSAFEKLAGISYSSKPIAGRLLEATLLDPEEIILQPGEKIEKTLQIKEAFAVPRQLKIQFTTVGETVLEKEVEVEQTSVSGTAVDVDTETKLVDIYALLVPVSKELKEYYEEGESSPTGGAVSDFLPQIEDQYMMELSLDKEKTPDLYPRLPLRFLAVSKFSSLFFKTSTAFSDLYGPYQLKEGQAFIFAQQFEYKPEIYKGDYLVRTKIFRNSDVIVDNEFEVQFGEEVQQPRSQVIWLVPGIVILLLIGEALFLLLRPRREEDDF